MIGLLDSFTLARTKLRTKKLLLIATIAVAALAFGIIIAGMLVVTGASRSADAYLKTALDGKYLVAVQPIVPAEVLGYGSMIDTPPEGLRTHLLELQKQYIQEQEVLAKKHNVTFDSNMVDPILKPSPFGTKDAYGDIQEVINRKSPAYSLYLAELQDEWLKTARNTMSQLKTLADADGATAYYQNQYASITYLNTFYLDGGKEDLSKVVQPDSVGYDPFASAIQNSQYTFTDQSLVARYILPENQARKDNPTAIPVVITKQEAVKLFGDKLRISTEPSNPADKISWMTTLYEKVNGLTYEACYRSPAEVALIQQIMRENQTAAKGKPTTASTPIIYNLPTAPCDPVSVKEDKRTAAQKIADSDLEAYQKEAGVYQPRIAQKLTFQIVGVMTVNSSLSSSLNNLPGLVDNLLSAQYQGGAFIPNQFYDKLPRSSQHSDILQSFSSGLGGEMTSKIDEAGVKAAIISFSNAGDAKKFMDEHTCFTQDQSSCQKPWTSQLYGANYLIVDDVSKKIGDIARLVLPIALAVAAIVMSFTMARVIIDSRHETAIFRALGAKRIDIIRIYVTYSIMVAALVAIFSFILGFSGAIVIEILYSADLTSYAKVAYGVFNQLDAFTLVGIDIRLLGLVAGAIFIVGIIAVLPPLLRNVRRSPIRDMRDDG